MTAGQLRAQPRHCPWPGPRERRCRAQRSELGLGRRLGRRRGCRTPRRAFQGPARVQQPPRALEFGDEVLIGQQDSSRRDRVDDSGGGKQPGNAAVPPCVISGGHFATHRHIDPHEITVNTNMHFADPALQRPSRGRSGHDQNPSRADQRMPGKRQLGTRSEDPHRRSDSRAVVDEDRFGKPQVRGDALHRLPVQSADVLDDPEMVSAGIGPGEYPHHGA